MSITDVCACVDEMPACDYCTEKARQQYEAGALDPKPSAWPDAEDPDDPNNGESGICKKCKEWTEYGNSCCGDSYVHIF